MIAKRFYGGWRLVSEGLNIQVFGVKILLDKIYRLCYTPINSDPGLKSASEGAVAGTEQLTVTSMCWCMNSPAKTRYRLHGEAH